LLVLGVAPLLELLDDDVQEHFLQDALRLGLSDQHLVLGDELVEDQPRKVGDLLLQLEHGGRGLGAGVGDRNVALYEHLNDGLEESSDLISAKRVDGGQLLVLTKALQDVLSCVHASEKDADVVHGVDQLAEFLDKDAL
jgi:hypothetical protein